MRYRFGEFVLSPRRRVLVHRGRELPLIPRYFDLLTFLVERRHEAVHRRAIFDRVWSDVIVSDSALSQAIRTLRRTLGDDPREPRFIRTISRHGYRFVFSGVTEEPDDDGWMPPGASEAAEAGDPASDRFEALLDRAASLPSDEQREDEAREAAELLHALGTAEALRRLGTRPGHAAARARLRDTRWNVPGAGEVPILGQPGAMATAAALVRLRLRRALRIVARRSATGSAGAGAAGALAGSAGGLLLMGVPAGTASAAVLPVLALIGSAAAPRAGPPLARLVGEPEFGRLTGALVGTTEGALFGAGLALGLTRRTRP